MAGYWHTVSGFMASLWGCGAGTIDFWIIFGGTLLAAALAITFFQSLLGVTLTEFPRTLLTLLFGMTVAVSAMAYAQAYGQSRIVVWLAGGGAVLLLAVPLYVLLHRPKWSVAITLWILVSASAAGASMMLRATMDAIGKGEKSTAPAAAHKRQIEQILNQ